MRLFQFLALIFVTLLLQPWVAAQEERPAARHLSLEEAVAWAIHQSLDIRLAEYDRAIERTRLTRSLAPFDPVLEADIHYKLDESENSSVVAGSRKTETTLDFKLEKQLQTGTTLTTRLDNTRTSTNSTFANLNPAFTSGWELEITQALAQNWAGVVDRAKVTITRLDVQGEDLAAVDRIEAHVADVAKTYWELAATLRLAELQERAVARAQALYQSNLEKEELGLVEPPERLASEAHLKQQQEALWVAQNRADSAASQLKLLLSDKSDQALIPSQSLVFTSREAEYLKNLSTAFEHRRDYSQAKLDLEEKGVQLKLRQNEALPELDLIASFRANGLEDSYADALGEAANPSDSPAYFVGLNLKWPWGDKEAAGFKDQAQLEKAQALLNLYQVERHIAQEVDEAVRSFLLTQEQVQGRDEIEQLYRKRLDREVERFEYGRSSVDNLIDTQEDLIRAERSAVEALRLHHRAWVDLKRAEHTLLSFYGYDPEGYNSGDTLLNSNKNRRGELSSVSPELAQEIRS